MDWRLFWVIRRNCEVFYVTFIFESQDIIFCQFFFFFSKTKTLRKRAGESHEMMKPLATTNVTLRFSLTMGLVLVCALVSWIVPFVAPLFVAFGVAFGHIWFTFRVTNKSSSDVNQPRLSPPPPALNSTTSRTSTTNCSSSSSSTSPPAYEKLSFVIAEGAQLVGKNSYILNHPLSVVSHAVYNKFPTLPCAEVPELLSVELVEETSITESIVQRKRIITSANTLPAAVSSAMGLAETTMVLEQSEEVQNVSLDMLVQNEEGANFAALQIWEHFEQLPNGQTKYNAETYLSTPGLGWGLPYIVQRYARSEYDSKSPLSKEILIQRCQQVADGREHEERENEIVVETTNEAVPLETPSKPA